MFERLKSFFPYEMKVFFIFNTSPGEDMPVLILVTAPVLKVALEFMQISIDCTSRTAITTNRM